MKQIEFLTIEANTASTHRLQELLGNFSKRNACEVESHFVNWDDVWQALVQTGIYRRGSDISEVGTSWLDSLSAMDTLRLVSNKEVNALGGESAFLPATWQCVARTGAVDVEAIPFRADVRVIFYWKDMVEEAGLDPAQIFRTASGMYTDMEALQRVCATPWGVVTRPNARNTLYFLASWVWGMGGRFIEPNGKKVAFTSPQAMEGMRWYYELGRFLPEPKGPFIDDQVISMFLERKVAAVLAGPWFFTFLNSQNWTAEQISRIGIASPPGPSFVGGTCLVMWRHSLQPEYVLDLIKFLTSTAVQSEYCSMTGFLPVRKDTWAIPPFSTDAHYQALYQALLHGRAFRPLPLWGLVEDRLTSTLGQIWADLRDNPKTDPPALLHKYMEPLAQRLNMTLTR